MRPAPERAQRELTMSEALNEALHEEMERDPGVFVIGEDIAQLGGPVPGHRGGLLDRVRAAAGDRRADLRGGPGRRRRRRRAGRLPAGGRAADRRLRHARRWIRWSTMRRKWRYMSGGRVTVPFVLRGAVSSGIGMAAQHSQTPRGVVRARAGAGRDHAVDPVRREGAAQVGDPRRQPRRLPREAAALQPQGPVPEEEYVVPIGVADVKREGGDVTVVDLRAGRPSRAAGGRAARARGHRGRGDRPADAEAARPRDDRRVGARRRAGSWSSPRRATGGQLRERGRRASDSTRRSTRCARRRCA